MSILPVKKQRLVEKRLRDAQQICEWVCGLNPGPSGPQTSPLHQASPESRQWGIFSPSMLCPRASPITWDQKIGVVCPRPGIEQKWLTCFRNNPLWTQRWGTEHFSLLLKRSTWRQQDPEWDLLAISESSACSLQATLRLIPTPCKPHSPPPALNTSWHQANLIKHYPAQGHRSRAQEGGILLAQTSPLPMWLRLWVRAPH